MWVCRSSVGKLWSYSYSFLCIESCFEGLHGRRVASLSENLSFQFVFSLNTDTERKKSRRTVASLRNEKEKRPARKLRRTENIFMEHFLFG